MPKLWNETLEAHRRSVREATLDVTAGLVAARGLRGVTMSEIAQKTGIGRATLYKYFPDVETILSAWHQRQINEHLAELARVRDESGTPSERLEAVLTTYAGIQRERTRHHHAAPHGQELNALIHMDEQVNEARGELHRMIRDLIAESVASGDVRDDVAPAELAAYTIHALEAAGHVPSGEAATRLVAITLAGLRPEA